MLVRRKPLKHNKISTTTAELRETLKDDVIYTHDLHNISYDSYIAQYFGGKNAV